MYYKQCVLQRGNQIQTCWIPEQYAHKNKYVALWEKELKKIVDGWEIITVSEFRMNEEQLMDYSQDYKHQRKASDI